MLYEAYSGVPPAFLTHPSLVPLHCCSAAALVAPPLQLEALHLDPAFLNRGVNQGFSGVHRCCSCALLLMHQCCSCTLKQRRWLLVSPMEPFHTGFA